MRECVNVEVRKCGNAEMCEFSDTALRHFSTPAGSHISSPDERHPISDPSGVVYLFRTEIKKIECHRQQTK